MILGLDLSLNSTGVAILDDNNENKWNGMVIYKRVNTYLNIF